MRQFINEIKKGMHVTYTHPVSGNTCCDKVFEVSVSGTITLDRKECHSSRRLQVNISQVKSFTNFFN
jgi:hypothetical protein